MTRSSIISAIFLVLQLMTGQAFSQPKLISSTPASYRPGDQMATDTWVLDHKGAKVRVLDLIEQDTQVVVLILFGGAAAEAPEPDTLRGGLWCEDSFDDLSVQRAIIHNFKGQPVQFIPVALPPVFHAKRFGYGEDVFLGRPENSPEYKQNVRSFIELTEALRDKTILPFEKVYYDPKYRLAQNRKERELGPEYGPAFEWQGMLKWQGDPRKYGTPTIWLLDPGGQILQKPFVGNDYDAEPPEIYYGYSDLKAAIEKWLSEEPVSGV